MADDVADFLLPSKIVEVILTEVMSVEILRPYQLFDQDNAQDLSPAGSIR